ncbi:hypothetical protein [Streptomyces sp. CBMA123]|uniref:hypothetical protein n=1 Tax=Streptomyces sp. CBMA123 TaxID=1896313 RepID=UPI001661B9BC|nr:hypothetical protein [Streptomyces sp. CBMA123]MBD0693795.1 hypothetical protein [Streptomyces sp. CBMA123]
MSEHSEPYEVTDYPMLDANGVTIWLKYGGRTVEGYFYDGWYKFEPGDPRYDELLPQARQNPQDVEESNAPIYPETMAMLDEMQRKTRERNAGH